MARDIDPSKTILLPQEERDKAVGSISDVDAQYLRERPWMIDEYRRQGYNDEMDKVVEGSTAPEVSPEEASRVTTDEMRIGNIPRERTDPQPNGVVPSDADDEFDDEYDGWTKQDLIDEVNQRNQDGRTDEAKLSTSGTKQELIDRLRADDESVSNA